MSTTQGTDLLLMGTGFGLVVSVLGALVEYRLHFGKDSEGARAGTPWFVLVSGFLCFLGLVATVVSLVLTGSIRPAVIMGIGVGVGYYSGFLLMLSLWLILERVRQPGPSGGSGVEPLTVLEWVSGRSTSSASQRPPAPPHDET